jgi:hypothetical protein
MRTIPLRCILAAVAASGGLRQDLEAKKDQTAAEPGTDEFLKSFSGYVHPR